MTTFEQRLNSSIKTQLETFKNQIPASENTEIILLKDYIDISLNLPLQPLFNLPQSENNSNSTSVNDHSLFKQIMALECIKSQCEIIISFKNNPDITSIINPVITWIKNKLTNLWSLLMTLVTPKGWSISGSIGTIVPFSSSATLKINFGT